MFDFDLDGLLNEPTTQRSEVSEDVAVSEDVEFDLDGLEFEPIMDTVIPADSEQDTYITVKEEAYTDEMAHENAVALVDLIDIGQTAVLTPLAKWKISKKRGVSGKIAQMEIVAVKHFEGAELTKREKALLYQYNAYLESLRRIEEQIPYTQEERERLTAAAKKYVRDTKLNVSKGLGFWGELAIIQGTRVLEIITA